MSSPASISLHLHEDVSDRQINLPLWQAVADKAHPLCLAKMTSEAAPLGSLEEVEITFVDDATIAQVHAEFMDDPTATDVITFHHGEILISLDTAAKQAADHGEPYERETARYIVHGLLHLAGWNDLEPAERAEMHSHQEDILARVLAEISL